LLRAARIAVGAQQQLLTERGLGNLRLLRTHTACIWGRSIPVWLKISAVSTPLKLLML
jgi:hypothetical protein